MTQTEGGRTAKRAMQKKDLSVCRSGPARQGPNDTPPPAPPGRDILAASTAGIRTQATARQQVDPGRPARPMLCWHQGLTSTVSPRHSTSTHGHFSPFEASALPAPPQQSRWWSSSAFRVPDCFPHRRSAPPTAAAPSTTWPCHTTYVPPLSHRAQRHGRGASFGVLEPRTARLEVAQRHRCAPPNDTPWAGNAGQTTKTTRLTTIRRADRHPTIFVGARCR
jgi:hypothetical protein